MTGILRSILAVNELAAMGADLTPNEDSISRVLDTVEEEVGDPGGNVA